jgi:hypothetical protein
MSDSGNNSSFNWMNWVMGIAATVIAAVLVAYFTGKDKEPPTPTPLPTISRQADVKTMNLPTVTLASTSEATTMQVEVLNEGNSSAESCQIQVNDETSSRLTNSSFFGLLAGDIETIDVLLGPFDQSLEFGAKNVSFQVICANGQSRIYKVTLSILP